MGTPPTPHINDDMSASREIVAVSPSQAIPLAEADSQLTALVYDVSQHMQVAMENMLKMINDIDQSTSGITEEIEKCKESAVERKKILEDEKDRFQKAAFTVLEMLNVGEIN